MIYSDYEDILYGNGDHDDLFGGSGSDRFVCLEGDFDFGGTVGFDEIHDFSLTENDKLDISDLMFNYDPLSYVVTDFFKVTNNGTHSYGKIDIDGTDNGVKFDQIFKFVNVVLDDSDFTAGGNLII